MAVNFNSNSVFNLKPINVEEVRKEVDGLLIGGEQIEFAFQTFRDQLIFTNKRIISVDVQGITGKRKNRSNLSKKFAFTPLQNRNFRYNNHRPVRLCSSVGRAGD